MPLNATNFYPKGPVTSGDMRQFYDLFTGVMTDQPATFRNVLSIGGNQGVTTVPLKVYGAVGQNTNLIDLYTDRTAPQPGFGFSALGAFAWGPGGAAPQDTFLSRIGTQNGHAGDTAGIYINPGLEVEGPSVFDSSVAVGGALTAQTLTVGAGGAGTLSVTRINFNANAWLQAYATDNTFVETPKLRVNTAATMAGTLTVGGASTFNAAVTIASGLTVSGANNVVFGQDLTVSRNLGVTGTAVLGRLVVGGYDAGQTANFGANAFTNGRFYQKNSASAYCYDALDFTYSPSVVGNTLVQRDASGYINASYINMSANVATGKPAYVAGHSGDSYLRWWPINAIGPPAWSRSTFTLSGPANGNYNRATITTQTIDSNTFTNNGSYITLRRAGYYAIWADVGGYYSVGVKIYADGVQRAEGTDGNPDFAGAATRWFSGPVSSSVFFDIRAQVTCGGNVEIVFVPTPDYNG